ncbi:hypothetical protein [Oceanobacillus bengalensis]|uniref:Polymerase nucleotidyl transferase domain-containing protein n=1 Tax=Oceanobacillus bengalensis TaxID=1435466 RepID=A0A494Z023_9BACI|nr:hypothetical protein [Oceanobacillus bengalensis]RKQ15870.1 hypothetical protein D8M05_08915 [Oceanobacillus bengalensis]
MNSLERAAKRKLQAEKILNELQLIQKWNTVGDCYIVGSVAYDLIVTPDIDIETFCKEPNPQIIMSKLALLTLNKNVVELKYRDYTSTDFNGHYFKLIYQFEGIDWNIDMWLFSNNRSGALSRDLLEFMKDNLTEETRKAILDIKESLLKLNEKYSSIFIYQAVLEFGVRNIDDFLEWTKNHNTTVPFHWQPNTIYTNK